MQKLSAILLSAMVFLIALFYAPCADAQKIEYEDGVRIVHNDKPKWGDNPKIALEFVKQIGVFEGPDENYMFYLPYDIEKDSDGNIYILDAGNYRIQKFDPDGKYLATLGSGRRGQGPSEFERPISLEIDSEGNLYVGNDINNLVIILNSQGKEIRRFRIKGELRPNFRMTENKNFIMPNIPGLKTSGMGGVHNKKEDGLLKIYDNQGNFIREFVQRRMYGSGSDLNFLGNDINLTIDTNNNIYVSCIQQNRIEKYSDNGVLILKIDRKKDYSKTTKVKTIFYGPIPYVNIFSISMDVDSKGRIWVLSLERQPTDEERESSQVPDIAQLEIFNNSGVLLCNIHLDRNVNKIYDGSLILRNLKIRIFDDFIYVIDPYTEMVVYEYKIIEK